MTFLEAFLWGSGLSLGLCVGLVAWLFLKAAVYKLLGVDGHWEAMRNCERAGLAALLSRNELTVDANGFLERIAQGVNWSSEDEDEDDEDDSEDWKNGRHQP